MRTGWTRHVAAALVALVALLALPIGVSADTCACDPIQPFLVVDRFDETHVTYRNADRPGIVYATNKSGSWTKRRITGGKDEAYAIAVDANQKVAIVFRREIDDGVRFMLASNRTGEWLITRLPIVHNRGYRVRAQFDADRSLHLTWGTDGKVWYATNASGAWERRRLDIFEGDDSQLAIDGQGNIHLVYEQCTDPESYDCVNAGIYYQTNASGSWVTTRLSTDQEDKPQDVLVDPNGRVHIVFVREYNSQAQPNLPLGVFYLTNVSGTWRTSKAAAPGRMANIERARDGTIHIVFARVDGNLGIFLATRRNGIWTRSEVVLEYAMYPTTGIESDGQLHLAYMRMAIDPGIYHSKLVNGTWNRRELMD